MGKLDGRVAVVTGGSRGLGRGMVRALAAEGASVWALARDAERLEALASEIGGVQTLSADVTDPDTASRVVGEIEPDILVLNAGTTPRMASVPEQSWEEFTSVWDTDVRSTFHFCKEALSAPLARGGTVVTVSSGAAIGGSYLSGGYAGAKRMQWLLSNYAQQVANERDLGLRFVTLLPRQIVGATDLGHAAATGYANNQGVTKEAFLENLSERVGAPHLTPETVGEAVVKLVSDPDCSEGEAYGVTGAGIGLLE